MKALRLSAIVLIVGVAGQARAVTCGNGFLETFTQISAGKAHSCGLDSAGAIDCWGAAQAGQSTPPAGSFTEVAAGWTHTCAVTSAGTAACWGSNGDGRASPPAGSFTEVSAGKHHSCGLDSAGELRCWGRGATDSDCGDPAWECGQSDPPAGTFTAVSAGRHFVCAISQSGAVQCWGRDNHGQASPPAGSFAVVSAGWAHSCAIGESGAVQCWGRNNDGESDTPAGTFTAVATGSHHSCAVTSSGAIQCWGRDDDGQASPPAGSFTEVSAGRFHSCALASSGTVQCWGNPDDGRTAPPTLDQCDDGNTADGDGCSAGCVTEYCGDGIVQAGIEEECDTAGESAACDSDCTLAQCGDGHVNPSAGESCEDADSDDTDGCLSNCVAASCGDGHLHSGVEACDDGNTTNGDTCSGYCEIESTQTEGQQRCINALNKAAATLTKVQGKTDARCIKHAGKGKESDPQTCLWADRKGKVIRFQLKVARAQARSCIEFPDFGQADADLIARAVLAAELSLARDVFGADLNTALLAMDYDKAAARSQAGVARAYEKIVSARLDAFVRCKKAGLASGQIDSGAALAECFDEISADPKGRVAKARAKVAKHVTNKWRGSSLIETFTGRCVTAADGGEFAQCIGQMADCRACQMLNAIDGLSHSCDAFDDGVLNGSCWKRTPPVTGACPPPIVPGLCVPWCGADSDCPAGHLCCINACGSSCLTGFGA